ncbi:MAG: DUF4476 domain-containing protein [Myxococcota bacterium]|nr:DUF4476 domain-containing protein [Myxococcota bacterium]
MTSKTVFLLLALQLCFAPEVWAESTSEDAPSDEEREAPAGETSEPEEASPAEAGSEEAGEAPPAADVPVQPAAEAAPPQPGPDAAQLVQEALNRLGTMQALLVASEEGQTVEDRERLAAELLAARRELGQALVAIGRIERTGELRALLEEAGLVLTPPERAAVEAEELRRRGLSAERFEEIVGAITAVWKMEGKLQVLRREMEGEQLNSAQAWSLVELFSLSRDRVEPLVFLHPLIVDPENFGALLSSLKFESDREIVRDRLGLDG